MPEESTSPNPPEIVRRWVVQRVGVRWAAVIFATVGTAWFLFTKWDDVRKWPIVGPSVTRWNQRPIPKADPNRFSVMVAHLENDDEKHGQERLIVEALKEFEGVQVLSLDRTIPLEGSVPEAMENRGHETARGYLNRSGASVLIWGTVLSSGGKTVHKLYWTASEGPVLKPGRYDSPRAAAQFRLPELFWSDLAAILRLLVASRDTEFKAKEENYLSDQLLSFISQVRRLLEASEGRPGWDTNTKEATRVILADALAVLGKQSGKADYLEQSIAAYHEALKVLTRDRVPLQWAAIQNNLGSALLGIGEWEIGSSHLEEAVDAYREALKERTRDRVPLAWVSTQNNLGAALQTLGERENWKVHFEEALIAYREELKVLNRDQVPLDWAATQINLGSLLIRIGERESGTGHLEEALIVLREALEVVTHDQMPLSWAATQVNLGNALYRIGERKKEKHYYEEAATAYREALKENTRDRVPLEWAGTQRDLANALFRVGQLESGTVRLEEAATAYREALKENTRDRVPLEWAATQHGLGNALFRIGERESGTGHLEESIVAYRAAFGILQTSRDTSMAKKTEDGIRRSQSLIGFRRTGNTK